MKPAVPTVLRDTRLQDQVRERIRYKYYNLRTERAHVPPGSMSEMAWFGCIREP